MCVGGGYVEMLVTIVSPNISHKINLYIPNNDPNKVVFSCLVFGENDSVSNKEAIS